MNEFLEGYESLDHEKPPREIIFKTTFKSPSSVLFSNYRSVFPDNYPAKFDEEIARRLIAHYSKEAETILDPFCGSGIIPIEAVKMNRRCIAQDINPVAVMITDQKYDEVTRIYGTYGKLKTIIGDARTLQIKDNSVDFILTSPPFGTVIDAKHIKYSDIEKDIANTNYDDWRLGMQAILKELYRVLSPNRIMCIEIRPRAKDGMGLPLFYWIMEDSFKIGFTWFCEYIEVVDLYSVFTMGKEDARRPYPSHSYLLLFQKPENEKLI